MSSRFICIENKIINLDKVVCIVKDLDSKPGAPRTMICFESGFKLTVPFGQLYVKTRMNEVLDKPFK